MNKTLMGVGIALLAVILIAVFWVMGSYNGLVSGKENVRGKWGNIQAQYQRRMDLIPNIVEAVKGSANFEQSTLQAVVEARSAWAKAGSEGNTGAQVAATNQFDSALSRLLVTVEAYPDLKSTQAFRDLNASLEGTENRIAVSRKDYNDAVQSYNLSVKSFPSNIIAGMFGFAPETFFEADAGAATAPKVQFDFNNTTTTTK